MGKDGRRKSVKSDGTDKQRDTPRRAQECFLPKLETGRNPSTTGAYKCKR